MATTYQKSRAEANNANGVNGNQKLSLSGLRVIIIGGGIGGLTAAIALRQQGHDVEVYEQSRFANEIGAAIHMVPNASGLLRRLGVHVEEEGAVLLKQTRLLKYTGELFGTKNNMKGSDKWQNEWFMAHRAHLHTHLKDVATSSEGAGIPVRMHTSSKIERVHPHTGEVVLHDGTHIQGDVIVGADGVNSVARSSIDPAIRAIKSHENAMRFLLTRKYALDDPVTHDLADADGSMDMWYAPDRKVVIYPCANKEFLNFVCVHPAELSNSTNDYNEVASKTKLLEIYKDFEPRVMHMLQGADQDTLKVYPLYDMKTLPTFVNDRLALIGDAAHPFTPHLAQGGAMAVEDAISLSIMLSNRPTRQEIPERLQLYNKARYERATTVQNYSRIAGKDGASTGSGTSGFKLEDFSNYALSHDEHHASTQVLREYFWSQKPEIFWRAPTVFGPMPGPRQDFEGNSRTNTLKDSSTVTAKISFKTSATLLRNMFPNANYRFMEPDTVALASFSVQTLKNLDWLGGGGYELFTFSVHGVEYKAQDGRTLHGSYCPVIFENLTDPILSGREELGYPKLYSDIYVSNTESSCNVTVGWRGSEWATISLHDLVEQEPLDKTAMNKPRSDSNHVQPEQSDHDQGLFLHKCVPATSKQQRLKSRADAEYDVFIPDSKEGSCVVTRVLKAKEAKLKISDLGVGKLPTLHHIVSRLAEVPIFSIVEAKITTEQGVSDLSNAERIS